MNRRMESLWQCRSVLLEQVIFQGADKFRLCTAAAADDGNRERSQTRGLHGKIFGSGGKDSAVVFDRRISCVWHYGSV